MNKKSIDDMIVIAMRLIQANELKILDNITQKIPSEYFSYLASFGPTVIQTGLIQAVTFYSNINTSEGKNRKKIIDLMEKVLKENKSIPDNDTSLTEYLNDQWTKKDNQFARRIQLETCVMEACTACKLAIRTFPKKEKDNNNA